MNTTTKKARIVKVGDSVTVEFNRFNGTTHEPVTEIVTVIKINRYTFDAKNTNGDVYRLGDNDSSVKSVNGAAVCHGAFV
jgi:hypothetical protein